MVDDLVLISIGSNIQPENNIPKAVHYLEEWFGAIETSNVFETPPVGTVGKNFLNLAVAIHTTMPVEALKYNVLRQIEARLGRVRTANKNDPRTIDLDTVVYHGSLLDPDLFLYAHLAVPVAELAPDFIDTESKKTLAEIARDFLQTDGIRLINGILATESSRASNPKI